MKKKEQWPDFDSPEAMNKWLDSLPREEAEVDPRLSFERSQTCPNGPLQQAQARMGKSDFTGTHLVF